MRNIRTAGNESGRRPLRQISENRSMHGTHSRQQAFLPVTHHSRFETSSSFSASQVLRG